MEYDFDRTLDHRKTTSARWLQPEGRNDVIGMGTADLDFYCPPCVEEANMKVCKENTFNYRYKPRSYYQAVTSWFRRHYQLELPATWLSNILGTLGAVHMCLCRFTHPGDWVIIQSPYFMPLKASIEAAGCHFLENPMKLVEGRYEIDFADFEEKVRKYRPSIFLLVNPQNPTGRVFTREELEQLVEICDRYQVLILSDEVHFLVTYDGRKHIPIYGVSRRAQEISIQIFSYSKGFNIMSIPHAMVFIADPELRRKWEDYVYGFNFNYASNSFAIASVTAVAGGQADGWLDQLTAYLQGNRDYFLEAVARLGLPLKPLKPEASFLFWIDCRESGIPGEKLKDFFLEKAGISLNNGLDHGETGRGFVRMNFGVTRKTLETAVDRLQKAF